MSTDLRAALDVWNDIAFYNSGTEQEPVESLDHADYLRLEAAMDALAATPDPAPADGHPKAISEPPPFGWRIWWRFGFTPFCRIVYLLTRDDRRREAWITPVDIWAMNTYRRLHRRQP